MVADFCPLFLFFPAEVGIDENSALIPGVLICDHCVRRVSAMLGSA
jgi:hypothetical protein